MKSCARILLAFCLGLILFNKTWGEPVVISGDGNEIEVRRILSGQLVKTFKINEYDELSVAAFYEEDMLFYASDEKIYKLVLLDDNGQPTISKTGKLLTDPLADHQETYLFEIKYGVTGLVVDKVRRKLVFAGGLYDVCEINFDGSGFQKIVTGNRAYSLAILGNQLYFSNQATTSWKSGHSIFRTTITSTNKTIICKQKGDPCQEIVTEAKDFVRSMMIEKYSKKLFFRRGKNVIAVVDTNLPDASYPVKTPRVVISDSQYVDGYGGIAVHGNRLVWNREYSSNGQLLLGLMNKDLNFVSKRKIYLYGKPTYDHDPIQLDVFEHVFPTRAPTTVKPMTTQGQSCMCPCSCSST